jgi:hypothetical protein
VDDDGVEAHVVELFQSRAETVEMLGEDSSSDLDYGELGGGNRAELGEVLLYLPLGADVVEDADDCGPSRLLGLDCGILPALERSRGSTDEQLLAGGGGGGTETAGDGAGGGSASLAGNTQHGEGCDVVAKGGRGRK